MHLTVRIEIGSPLRPGEMPSEEAIALAVETTISLALQTKFDYVDAVVEDYGPSSGNTTNPFTPDYPW